MSGHRLILRHLQRDEEPSVGIVDVLVAEWIGHSILLFLRVSLAGEQGCGKNVLHVIIAAQRS